MNARCVIDNWLLESCIHLIAQGLPRAEEYHTYWGEYKWVHEHHDNTYLIQQRAIALQWLLDLVVTHDRILYDPAWAQYSYEESPVAPIHSLLEPIRVDPAVRRALTGGKDLSERTSRENVVEDGALHYVGLAQVLDAYYWPSPDRAAFLAERHFAQSTSFFVTFSAEVDKLVRQAIEEAVAPFALHWDGRFYGFGTAILAKCRSPHDLFKVAMEFRSTKACVGFRSWLVEMDAALRTGDAQTIVEGLRDARGVIAWFRRRILGLPVPEGVDWATRLSIGVSPSISLDPRAIGGLLPKPYHVTFLRRHVKQLTDRGAWYRHMARLFPNIRRRDPPPWRNRS